MPTRNMNLRILEVNAQTWNLTASPQTIKMCRLYPVWVKMPQLYWSYYSNSHHMSPRNPSTLPQYSWASTISWKSEADNGLKWSEMTRAYAILGNFKQSFPVDVCIHYEVFTESNIRLTAALIEFLLQSDLETMYPRFHRTPKEHQKAPLEIQSMPYLWPPQLVDILGFLLDGFIWFYYVLLYYVILRVVSNLQFVYFSSLGPPLTLVISGHLWTFAELQQLQRHVQRYQGINCRQISSDFIRLFVEDV